MWLLSSGCIQWRSIPKWEIRGLTNFGADKTSEISSREQTSRDQIPTHLLIPAVCPWATDSTSVSLCVSICKMEVMMDFTSESHCEG